MKRKAKITLIALFMLGLSINCCFAYDYVFAVKDNSENYYSPTTVDVKTIKIGNSVINYEQSNTLPMVQYSQPEVINLQIPYEKYTSKSEVLKSDGSIGTLKISEIDLNVKVYDGTTSSSLKKGVGHFVTTSYWEGNIVLAGHNRGVNSNFGKLKKLNRGDIITYTTNLGKRKYEVFYTGEIGVSDLSRLNGSAENLITLITCVENQPLIRLCVQAREME